MYKKENRKSTNFFWSYTCVERQQQHVKFKNNNKLYKKQSNGMANK